MDYEYSEDIFITVNAFNMFHGIKPFKLGSILKLVKDPTNDYDGEAIAVELRYAGRIYDKILDEDYAQVKFISNNGVIAKILTSEEINSLSKDPNSDINHI